MTEKRLQLAATLPAALCERLQLLPTYFDVTPKHIEENDKAIAAIKGNVTSNTVDIQTLQASVTQLQSDLTQMQSKYDATL